MKGIYALPTVQPPSVLLIGAIGSGKTYSLSTLAEAGLEVFAIITEPTGVESLLDAWEKKKLPIDKLHWKQITPARAGFSDLQSMASKIGTMSYESLTKLPPQGNRTTARFIQLLATLSNFTDDRTGNAYGPVDNFDPSKVLVIDSLSGLNLMAMDLVIGDKPTAHQGEWGVAMNAIEKLLNALSSGLRCTFVLTAHIDRETDEITGVSRLMAGALGRKLAPKLPRFFSEMVLAYREGSTFLWSTTSPNTDTKVRSLPLHDKLLPTFVPVIEAYRKRLSAVIGEKNVDKVHPTKTV
jgi:hypothetical protein